MKITVFTSNQPRHLALIRKLSGVAEEVYAVQECTTVHPGIVDDFYRKSDVMKHYFSRVIASEKRIFGEPCFLGENVRQLVMKMGDLSLLPLSVLEKALDSDVFIVFGSSYIKGPLVSELIEKRAVNIHMGTSPYYRGSSCNFWAMYDGRPDYVGATIHFLSKGLDSGDMLFHAFPEHVPDDPFDFCMQAVKSAQDGLCYYIKKGLLFDLDAIPQDRSLEIRYTRNRDFDDLIAERYLNNIPSKEEVMRIVRDRDESLFINPYYG